MLQNSPVQIAAVREFLSGVKECLGELVTELRRYTITDVRTNDRVSILMTDSFIESAAPTDRPFLRSFVNTQMFA